MCGIVPIPGVENTDRDYNNQHQGDDYNESRARPQADILH